MISDLVGAFFFHREFKAITGYHDTGCPCRAVQLHTDRAGLMVAPVAAVDLVTQRLSALRGAVALHQDAVLLRRPAAAVPTAKGLRRQKLTCIRRQSLRMQIGFCVSAAHITL
jgi:hypothetical protein